MKCYTILFAAACVITLGVVEARRLGKQNLDTESECCYPRPPAGRALKKELRKCSEFPSNEIWENFQTDIRECKERREQQGQAGPSTPVPELPVDKDTDNKFDADESEENDVDAPASPPPPSEVLNARQETEGREGRFHKGKGHGKFHRGRGMCVKEAMEKRAWAKDGVVDYDSILRNTETAFNESASEWIPVVREAITNCSKQVSTAAESPDRQSRHHGCGRGMTPEKKAWRCIVNNSILKSPTFPQENEYCKQLQTAHEKCLTISAGGEFRWCGSPRGGMRHNRPQKKTVQ